jgi:hypothetical protein
VQEVYETSMDNLKVFPTGDFAYVSNLTYGRGRINFSLASNPDGIRDCW